MTLSDFVKEYRKDHDLSQRQFAAICGLSNGYISMLEKNLNPKTGLPLTPSLSALKKIADGMGIPLGDMLTVVDDMPVELLSSISDEQKAPTSDHPTVTDDDIKFALFGGDAEITDAMYEEVKRFAEFVKHRGSDGSQAK